MNTNELTHAEDDLDHLMPLWFVVFYYILSFGLVPVALHWAWVWWPLAAWFILVGPIVGILWPPNKGSK